MTTPKKPGDETIKGLPSFESRSEDSFVGKSKEIVSELKKAAEAAPEVSQGAWRERAFTPRSVMSKEEIKSALSSALRVALASANHPRVAFDQVRTAWLPVLRQALEQGAGDGLDAWLEAILTPPGKTPKHPLFANVGDALLRMRTAKELAAFEEDALKLVNGIDTTLSSAPVKLSFKQMEKQLEGKLEVDELLAIRAGTTEELQTRIAEIGGTMTQLRDQIRKMPGGTATGMYSNFVRLKAELRVLDAEVKARLSGSGNPSP
ncbi:MAG: hypothetical protein JNM17_15635 [Archangium sp.]|nr:hypothetical protein [Archangium sp.]